MNGQRPNTVELTDLRATWPSGLTQDTTSADSSGIRSDFHCTSKKGDKDVLDISVPDHESPDVEAQESASVSLEELFMCPRALHSRNDRKGTLLRRTYRSAHETIIVCHFML